ncbi:MAG: maltose alpha-D-glucosyltransferase [Promicromonosporaceae bacterium]|nr:maltose alpha-D-glucosyltransferase [Promicromonosporaceae bacterium]
MSDAITFPNQPKPGLTPDPEWYRKAVFYEVVVRAFQDSNADGTGDIRGVINRLDYLQWLGIDCLWLPPFYPSPLRDGGYDVSDYNDVAPWYGTADDFEELLTEAHARGMRVIIDLVMNHTSDAHPWFQASRTDPDGPYGDFYVWADDDSAYSDARIIFVDTEKSNWTFDEKRGQYFWHRFFSHQPDLNFENPKVREAMLDAARFWLKMGIDGFRLDAVPYLYEAEGTNGENLPATHAFLAEVRAMVDAEFPGRILLAEANQMPDEVVAYFGTEAAPECHLCFHFPVMPRIFRSLREEKATPIVDIMAETPPIPVTGGQWATFLRNHDELTLEMVTDDERALMYQWYASDPRMRANVGIRRRLAPLLGNSLAEIKLANALLLSLPGSPCLYYGDEIGMGDNIWLPDRDGVRTPMQWTPDRNAGFSTADPGKLNLPVIQSLVYGSAGVNVEAQLAQPDGLLHWLRGLLAVRRANPVFGLGDYQFLTTTNDSVLAFTRTGDPATEAVGEAPGDAVLVVANLASTPQSAVINLPSHASSRATDLLGGAAFGRISQCGELSLTFEPRGFYWLKLTLDSQQ